MTNDVWKQFDRLVHNPAVVARYELKEKKRKEQVALAWNMLALKTASNGGKTLWIRAVKSR